MSRRLELGTEVQLESMSFRPRPMVQWLSPPQLLRSGSEVVLSGLFGKFADKRETQSWPQRIFEHHDVDELWLDFASDLGDGFDATYSIAQLLAAEELRVDGKALARGKILVLGGDEVYPSAGRQQYEDRFVGPYTAALPKVIPEEAAPWLHALPGNHDWYDGLSSFLRLFCQQRWIGGWRTQQTRSYFAMRLPGPWWLWAVDIQFDTEVDRVQRDYFLAAREAMNAGDRLLLVTAKPSWVGPVEESESYRNLAYIERKLVRDDVELIMTLTGDLHHYSRYTLEGDAPGGIARHRITAGGGGAYLSATHTLPQSVDLPREPWAAKATQVRDRYERVRAYPSIEESKRLARHGVVAPLKTAPFVVLVAALYAALAATALGPEAVLGGSVVVALIIVAALIGYADFSSFVAKLLVGTLHAALHIALVVAVLWLLLAVIPDDADVVRWVVGLVALAVAGAVLGSLLFGAYLLTVHRLRGPKAPKHTNEVFAGQGRTDHNCFLRLRVTRGGDLELYAIGLDESCEDWEVVDGPDGTDTIVPTDGKAPAPRIIDSVRLVDRP